MTAPERSEPNGLEPANEPLPAEDGALAAALPATTEAVEPAERPRPVRRRRKRTRFAVPERTAIAVRPLWDQASDEERSQAHRYAMAILESWTGRASWVEVAKKLGLPPVRVHQLSQQAVSGMLAGLLKQPRTRRKRGAPPSPPVAPEDDPALLRKRIKTLETKLSRTEDLVRVLQEFPWHRGESSAGQKRKQGETGEKKSAKRKARGRATAGSKAERKREAGGGPEGQGAPAPGA